MTDPLANRVRISKTGLFEMIPVLSSPPFPEEQQAIRFTEDCVRLRNLLLQHIMAIKPFYRTYRKIKYEDWRIGDACALFKEYWIGLDPPVDQELSYVAWSKAFLGELRDVGFTDQDAYLSRKLMNYFTFEDGVFVPLILRNDTNTVTYARMRGLRIHRVNEIIGESRYDMATL